MHIASLITVLASERSAELIVSLAAGFVLARSLSALSVLTFRSARKEGMLHHEAAAAKGGRVTNLAFAIFWTVLASAMMLCFGREAGVAGIFAAALSFAWYKYMSYKEFGGITGDLAGWFICICETAMVCAMAAAGFLAGT